MIAICISILCAILIYTTWKVEFLARKVRRLENDFFIEQVRLFNLKNDVSALMYKGDSK